VDCIGELEQELQIRFLDFGNMITTPQLFSNPLGLKVEQDHDLQMELSEFQSVFFLASESNSMKSSGNC
jgi:hypothetical protein